jgi:ABC-type multidrug transport system ATPase subunit
LEVRDLSKTLGHRLVLRRVNLSLNAGDVCAIVGSNGSGKSTLLKLLSGQTLPTSGTIVVCGQTLRRHPWFNITSDARRHLALVPDQSEALLELTGYEFLNLQYSLRRITPGAREAATEAALNLPEFAGQRLAVLSLGQRKRIVVAGSLGGGPPLWLLDEPTNALDADACQYLTTVVAERRAAGLITLATTHDERVLTSWGARVLPIEALQR